MYLHGLAAVLIATSLTIVLHSRMPDWARKTSSDVHNPLGQEIPVFKLDYSIPKNMLLKLAITAT